jgi:hypothetical protein
MKMLDYLTSRRPSLGLNIFLVMLLFGCSCRAPKATGDPLVGWHCIGFASDDVPKAIRDDYQTYIQQNGMAGYVGPIRFFENRIGGHAIEFEAFERNKNASWHYAFIYNGDNKRVNCIRYHYSRYQS